ncbi:hypothetical protein FB45DRAFT_1062442 [Roridomyces roridus]|uniref:Adenylate kinase n=1 Tax=Roridomyces roridus TaxID=1738132 RepID=A0AAD7BHX1_9AGAR|nr:hypothetical protein FB45DRAFT_1068034 [Roridomyces roridus]KAJ7621488.1 hypothetical protein FB45DRAFT_1062442 [Roridomyces roridus]
MSLPPLLGDANGRYRIRIVGNCGAGKSTVGKRLADILGVPFISLDALYWNPDWVQSSPSELRKKVAQALAAAPNGWVVDGNYSVKAGTMIDDAETDVIWLDPPLALTLSRVIRRTFLRLLRLVPPCSPGCSERFTEVFFSKSSVVWWCISHHWRLRRLKPWTQEVQAMDVAGECVGSVDGETS